MITFILPKINSSSPPPVPGGLGGPGPPGLPIDNGLILLFFMAIALGTYMYYKKVQKKEKVNAKNSLN